MKTNFFFLIPLAFAFSLLFSSCRKELEISEEDVVESIEAALKTNGSEDMALISTPYKAAACGFTNDTTVTRSVSGTDFNWSRTANWNWVVNCDSNNAFKAAILSSVRTVIGGYSGRHSSEATSSATIKHTVVTKMG
jgi:hypothetical protein